MHFQCKVKRDLSDKTRSKDDEKKVKGNPESTGSFWMNVCTRMKLTVKNASKVPDEY